MVVTALSANAWSATLGATIEVSPSGAKVPATVRCTSVGAAFGAAASAWLLAWVDADRRGVYATRVMVDGSKPDPAGVPLRIDASVFGSASCPSVAWNGVHWLVVWTEATGVWGALVATNGSASEAAKLYDASSQLGPYSACAAVAGNRFVVAWGGDQGGAWGRVDSAGVPLDAAGGIPVMFPRRGYAAACVSSSTHALLLWGEDQYLSWNRLHRQVVPPTGPPSQLSALADEYQTTALAPTPGGALAFWVAPSDGGTVELHSTTLLIDAGVLPNAPVPLPPQLWIPEIATAEVSGATLVLLTTRSPALEQQWYVVDDRGQPLLGPAPLPPRADGGVGVALQLQSGPTTLLLSFAGSNAGFAAYAERLDDSQQRLDVAPVPLALHSPHQTFPAGIRLDGGVVVVWREELGSATHATMARPVALDGTPRGPARRLSTAPLLTPFHSFIDDRWVGAWAGTAVAVWNDRNSIFGTRIDADGVPLDVPPWRAPASPPFSEAYPAVLNGGQSARVAWNEIAMSPKMLELRTDGGIGEPIFIDAGPSLFRPLFSSNGAVGLMGDVGLNRFFFFGEDGARVADAFAVGPNPPPTYASGQLACDDRDFLLLSCSSDDGGTPRLEAIRISVDSGVQSRRELWAECDAWSLGPRVKFDGSRYLGLWGVPSGDVFAAWLEADGGVTRPVRVTDVPAPRADLALISLDSGVSLVLWSELDLTQRHGAWRLQARQLSAADPPDAGAALPDGGSTGTDGGATGMDGGSTGMDGGSTGTDGGATGPDAGSASQTRSHTVGCACGALSGWPAVVAALLAAARRRRRRG